MARSPVATDNFNRANGAVGSNYTIFRGSNAPWVDSNVVGHSPYGGDDEIVYWNANSFANDQYSKAKVVAASNQSYTKLVVRYNTGDDAWVMVEKRYENTDFRIWWYDGADWTQLGSTYSGGFTANDILILEAEGTTVRVYQNDNLRISATNAGIPASGYPGFGFADQNNDTLDDWEGGDLIDAVHTPRMGFVNHQNPGIV